MSFPSPAPSLAAGRPRGWYHKPKKMEGNERTPCVTSHGMPGNSPLWEDWNKSYGFKSINLSL